MARLPVAVWGPAVVLALVVASTAVFTVDETERAIVTRFGRPLDGIAEPGLHLKLPWPVDSVVRLDARVLVFDNEPIEMLTADKKNLVLDTFLCWRIADPLRFTQTVKTRPETEARLLDIASSELGAAVGNAPMDSFISTEPGKVKVAELSRRVAAAVDAAARERFGIALVDLRINGVSLPPQNRASVIDRMRAERARIATKYRSEGEEEAMKIKGRRSSSARDPRRGARRGGGHSRHGRGPGHAALFGSVRGRSGILSLRAPLQAYEAIIDDKTTLFLESDSPLLKALQGPDGRP